VHNVSLFHLVSISLQLFGDALSNAPSLVMQQNNLSPWPCYKSPRRILIILQKSMRKLELKLALLSQAQYLGKESQTHLRFYLPI